MTGYLGVEAGLETLLVLVLRCGGDGDGGCGRVWEVRVLK